jgi:hypothetical protein
MIKLGSQEVTKIMKGSTEIASAYKGSDEVWSAGGSPVAEVRLLLLGGGGAGGLGSSADVGGGGGSGGYLEGTTSNLIKGVKYSVVIGQGGTGDSTRSMDMNGNDVSFSDDVVTFGEPGGDTSITSDDGIVIANAGGGGRGKGTLAGSFAGASTGGGNLYDIVATANDLTSTKFDASLQATGVLIKGNRGGTGVTAASNSGGGAGAGQEGQDATGSRGGYGGNGFQSDITGTLTYYGGGGGGGTDNYANGSGSPSRGGQGGGGAGAWWSKTVPAIKGTDYLGGGGGGGVGGSGTNSLTRAGASGGHGAVYIKTEAAINFTGDYEVVNSNLNAKAYKLKTSGELSFA